MLPEIKQVFNNHENVLREIRDFYEETKNAYSKYDVSSVTGNLEPGLYMGGAMTSTAVVGVIVSEQKLERIRTNIVSPLIDRLNNLMPVLMCSFWEALTKDVQTYFNIEVPHYHNSSIKEIFLIRHCILHNGSKADSSYINQTEERKFDLGESIKITSGVVREFFESLERAHQEIKAKHSEERV